MDDTRDSFGVVSRCRFIPNGIKCLKIKHHLRLFIAVWHSCYVTIFNCIDEKNKALFKEQTVEKDDLKFSHPIINIFMTNHCIYAADSIGTIYDLHYRVHHLDEAKNRCSSDIDMFDLSPGCLFGWVQSKTGILSQCDTLLAISAFKEKFIAISVFSENLLGHVYMLDTFCCLYTVTLLEAAVDKVVFTCIDVPLSEELKQQYFPFLNENDVEIPVIGLNCGQALAFSIIQQSDQAHTVFSSLQPIVAIDYNFDKELQKCSSILVLVSSGLLIMLTGKSSQLLYISAPVYIALFNRNQSILVSSDGADLMLTKIKFDDTGVIQESSIKSKVKAVQSVCTLSSMSDIILVGTQHCCVYWMDLSEIFLNYNEDFCKFVLPKEQIFDELLLTTKKLEEANLAMQREDSIMRAISLISRTTFLNKYFTILVKCYSGKSFSEEKLKLRIVSDSDIASFTPDIWSLNLTLLLGNNKTISYVHKLDKIFTKDFPLTVDFKCSPVVESELSCKMIAKIDDNQPLLIVPLGKVELDAGYFFSLVKNKSELLKQLVEPPIKSESSWDDYDMDNDNHDVTASAIIHDVECNSNKKMVFYSIKLDSSLLHDKVFQLIFRNSSHRMSKNQWMCLSETNLKEVTATIGHHYWVEINLNKEQCVLNIKSNNIYACYLVKKAIRYRLGTDNPVELDSNTYIEAEGMKYRFELARLRTDWDLKTFQDIKNEFRHEIMDKLSI